MPKRPPVFVPYIYTREELRRLLRLIESNPQGTGILEPVTIRTMLLVRLREATNLTCGEVDLNGSVLTIRNTKFGKTRLVSSQRMLDGDKRAKGPCVPDDVWEFPRLVGNAGERIEGHRCQLPESLLERVIRCSTAPGDTVLDPTAGTGTTLRVAQRSDRRYVGIEEQETFLRLIENRLEQPMQHELF